MLYFIACQNGLKNETKPKIDIDGKLYFIKYETVFTRGFVGILRTPIDSGIYANSEVDFNCSSNAIVDSSRIMTNSKGEFNYHSDCDTCRMICAKGIKYIMRNFNSKPNDSTAYFDIQDTVRIDSVISVSSPQLVGPSRVQLVKSDGLFSDTLYPSVAVAYDTSNDTQYTGDSIALFINPGLNDLRFSFLSFEDNYDYQSLYISRVRLLSKGDTILIVGDFNYWVSDAIVLLPQSRKHSLNSTIHLGNFLGAGNYKFVANITEMCYCIGVPTFNCVGDFSIARR
jgi:hypothetical protein